MATDKNNKSLIQLSEELNGYLFEPPQNAAERVRRYRLMLRKGRLADNEHMFEYSMPLTAEEKKEWNLIVEEREQFFTNVTLLIDRQPDDEVRYEVLCLLAEMSAIEKDFYRGQRMGGDTVDPFAFGKQALRTLLEIMPSVVNIREPFVHMVKDVLIEVLTDSSKMYVISVLPILERMTADDKFGSEIAFEFHDITYKLVEVFDFTRKLVRYGKVLNANSSSGVVVQVTASGDPSEQDRFFMRDEQIHLPVLPRCAFDQVCQLMSTCAENQQTAVFYHELAVSDLISVEKLHFIQNEDPPDNFCGECAVHKLMASLARNCKPAADNFTKPHGNERAFFLLESLIRDVKVVGEHGSKPTKKRKQNDHAAQHDARLISALNGILTKSEEACKYLNDSPEVNPNTFITNLMKIAKNSQGALTSAALEGLLVITHSEHLQKFKDTMEKECDLASKLQEIMKNLLVSTKNWNNSSRRAMMSSLSLMKMYSQIPEVSSQLNNSDFEGYDRESIVFKLLEGKDAAVTEEVKQKAAEVLRVVRLEEFDKSEIRVVVNMIASVPALVSLKTYDIMSNLIFLMFKMAMDRGDEGKGEDESCGRTFRDIYATEVVSAVFGNIQRAMEGDLANTRQPVEVQKRRFETASVKFLQTSWKQVELRQGMSSDQAIETLVKVMKCEQALLSHSRPRQFQNHLHLFLEQTPVGFEVEHLLKCVRVLLARDIVAFRVFHQIANVLEDIQNDSVLDALETAANNEDRSDREAYDIWADDTLCGIDLFELSDKEMHSWDSRFNILKTKYSFRDATEDDAKAFAEVQLLHARRVFKIPIDDDQLEKKWQTTLSSSIQRAPKIVHLIMEDRGKPVAVCGGGPLRGTSSSAHKGIAELYSIAVHPKYMSESEAIQRQLLMVFSHAMFGKGFKRCRAWVHQDEQIIYASTECEWLNQEAMLEKSSLEEQLLSLEDDEKKDDNKKKGGEDGEDGKKSAEEDEEGKKKKSEDGEALRMTNDVKPYYYEWPLVHNVWKTNTSHKEFLEADGIETMVHFLTKADEVDFDEYDRDIVESTMHTAIRMKMEAYGQVLMGILEKNKHAGDDDAQPRDEDEDPFDLDEHVDFKVFSELLEDQFRKVDDQDDEEGGHAAPMWDAQLAGTKEENFLQTVTLGLEKGAELKQVVNVVEEEQEEDAKRFDDDKAEQHPKSKFMKTQLMPNCAAMLRTFYVLLKGGSWAISQDARRALRQPQVFHAIRMVVQNVNYGIRRSVEGPLIDEYGVGMKFLKIMEELLYINPKGLQDCLLAMELFELMTQVLQDIFKRLVTLVSSRNLGSDDPLHKTRFLHKYEEMLISTACYVASELMNQVSQIQFFEGAVEVSMIYEGNVKCRKHALEQLFAVNNPFGNALQTFLLYDVELSTGLHSLEAPKSDDADDRKSYGDESERTPDTIIDDEKLGVRETSGFYRDRMRISVLEILGEMASFNDQFKYEFVEEYNRGLVFAELGLRPGFIQGVLSVAQKRQFRVDIESAMLKHQVITVDGESIVEHSFVEHRGQKEMRLLVLTNKFWYLSKAVIPADTSLSDVDVLTELNKFEYSNIAKLHRGYGSFSQFFGVEHIIDITDATGGVRSANKMDTFLCRQVGVASTLLRTFSRFARDDLNQPLEVSQDGFTERALQWAYSKAPDQGQPKLEPWHKRGRRKCSELLYTHCTIMRNNEKLDRVITWTTVGGSKHNLVEFSYDFRSWTPYGSPEMSSDNERLQKFLKVENVFDITKGLQSVEFTETAKSIMVLSFKNKEKSIFQAKQVETVTVLFKCDTAREQWRRALKENLPGSVDDWDASVLPDLYSQDRHTGKFI